MTREEFSDALLRFGADLTRWPQEEAKVANRLLEADTGAAKIYNDFKSVEREVAAAIEPPPFGAPEIGAVLSALDRLEENWRPAPKFWIASAGVTALSFVAGFGLMLAAELFSPDLPRSVMGLAMGQAELGGLL